jgi:hypothetical protein
MTTYPDGTLLKASGPEIDMMAGGLRRWIPDPTTFNDMGLDWSKVVVIPDSEFSAIPSGPAYPSRADGTLLQGSDPKVYVMQNGQRHWIPDPATFTASGYQASAIDHVSDADLNAIPEGIAVAEAAIAAHNLSISQLAAALTQASSQPLSVPDMIALQASMAAYTVSAEVASAVVKDYTDTLKSIAEKIG